MHRAILLKLLNLDFTQTEKKKNPEHFGQDSYTFIQKETKKISIKEYLFNNQQSWEWLIFSWMIKFVCCLYNIY